MQSRRKSTRYIDRSDSLVSRRLFREHIYYATGLERFRHDFRAPVVMLADADLLVTAPFTDLVEQVAETGAFAGLIAHASPFGPLKNQQPNRQWWIRIFREAGLAAPRFCCQHTGWGTLVRD